MAIWPRARALFTARDDTGVELVMTANGLASIGAGVAAALELGLTVPMSAAVVALVFVLLGACLLSRWAVWIAALLGGVIMGGASGLLLAAIAGSLLHLSPWVGGGPGFLLGLGFMIWTYRGLSRSIRQAG